jgi:hypothetical protein
MERFLLLAITGKGKDEKGGKGIKRKTPLQYPPRAFRDGSPSPSAVIGIPACTA